MFIPLAIPSSSVFIDHLELSANCDVSLGQQAMHKGVERDMEQRRLKQERQADFDAQRKLEEEYRKVQAVSDSSKGSAGNGKDSGKEDKQSGKG